MYALELANTMLFLSTLSLRRATINTYHRIFGEGISIHALLAESDETLVPRHYQKNLFLSTLSLRRATSRSGQNINRRHKISIHALLAESDQQDKHRQRHERGFLSTLSLRRATNRNLTSHCSDNDFYPRSPCGERRESRQLSARPTTYFYPRSPCGERHAADISARREARISIHALLAESDAVMNNIIFVPGEFLSTLSLRRATFFHAVQIIVVVIFLSTLSLRRATASQTNLPD